MFDNPELQRKIKTKSELAEVLGERPRQKSVIMCHGTFDVVHPGHLRHLIYAKSKADLLVASLTCDSHVVKADHRPFVPQDIRALNLAAFEVVDYVVVDEQPTPIETIKKIKPDYFAKGYEYFSGGPPPKTVEEINALSSYGGEIFYTPGDIVYSSSNLIEASRPNISSEKLAILMQAESISFKDLYSSLSAIEGIKVHLLGDTIIDTYSYCSLIGSGTKTPTPSVKFHHAVDYIGGAAVVAKHLRSAGAEVEFSTVLGEDKYKDFVLDGLQSDGIICRVEVDKTRPTTHKNAFICDGYRMLKVDNLDNKVIDDKIIEQKVRDLQASKADVYMMSDFRHGIFSKRTIPIFTESVPKGRFKVADSQVASRWGNILEFQGYDLVTPNEREARFALGDQDSVIRPLARKLYVDSNAKNLILKMGERGMLGYQIRGEGSEHNPRAFFQIDSFESNPKDPVGAGDALLAYSSLVLKESQSLLKASIIGSLAAAETCSKDGNNPVTPEAVKERLCSIEKAIDLK